MQCIRTITLAFIIAELLPFEIFRTYFACPGDYSNVDGRISKILGMNVDLDETVCRVQEPCRYLKGRGR